MIYEGCFYGQLDHAILVRVIQKAVGEENEIERERKREREREREREKRYAASVIDTMFHVALCI